MLRNSKNEEGSFLLEEFKRSIASVWANDGKNSWPVEINAVTHLFIDSFVSELFDDLGDLRQQGLSNSHIAALFETPARIIRLIMPAVQGLKMLGLTVAEQRSRILDLLELVALLKHGDPLSGGGRNIVLSPAALEEEVTASLEGSDADSSASVHQLCGILWAYSEALRLKAHGLCRQFHGPYTHATFEGELLIRDFLDMRPTEIWEECAPAPVRSVRVIGVYQDLGLQVDIYDNPRISSRATYRDRLIYYRVEADGRRLSLDEIRQLSDRLCEVMLAVTGRIDAMEWRDLAVKYAEIFWASKRRLRAALQRESRVPNEVRERVLSGQLDSRHEGLSGRDTDRLLRFAF